MASSIAAARHRLVQGIHLIPELGEADRAALAGFLGTAAAYAQVEVAALGAIEYDLPVHFGGPAVSPRADGEQLAARERDLFGLAAEGDVDLVSLLESRGVKVIGATVGSDLGSVFTYEAAIGPAIFVNTASGGAEARFWLAHAYAHLVADVDPYRVRVCRPGESRLVPSEALDLDEWYASAADLSVPAIAASEERANAFAEAFLMPAELLATFVAGARREMERPLSPDVFAMMESYFGASARRIADRFVHLGALSEDAASTLAREAEVRSGRDTAAAAASAVPRRMVDLAIGAFHRSKLSLDRLARVLGADPEAVRELLRAYDLVDHPEEPSP